MASQQFTKYLFDSPSVLSGEEPDLKRSDFTFEKKLGEGAFGQVWIVCHKISKAIYALKQVPKEKVLKMLSQFKREVYIMYNLNHPHIIKLYNHFEDEKYFYLIMECSDGGNLFHRLQKQRQFIEVEAAQYFREIVLAVEYLHSHVPAIIHRDIKPENILLDSQNRVKLTDFGWSNYWSKEELEPRKTVCGTMEYLPPEMIEEKDHNTSVDIWCLGVLLYEMLVGFTPFKSQSKRNLLVNIARNKPKFPLSFPPLARDLICRMLSKNPNDRPSITEVKEDRWLKELPALKETVSQMLAPIPLPQYHESIPVDFKCYKVISEVAKEEPKPVKEEKTPKQARSPSGSESDDLDLSYSSDGSEKNSDVLSNEFLDDIVCKESIKQMKDIIEERKTVIRVQKSNIGDIDKNFKEANEELEKLEGKVKEKNDELLAVQNKERQLNNQIADIDVQMQTCQHNVEDSELIEKIHTYQKLLIEKSSETSIYLKKREGIKEKLRDCERLLNEKEIEFSRANTQLLEAKKDLKGSNRNMQMQFTDLTLNADILKSRIDNFDHFCKALDPDEFAVARDIQNFIRDKKNEIPELKEREILLKIKSREEIITKIEQEIIEQKIEHEDQKSDLFRQYRKKKEDTINNCKLLNEKMSFEIQEQINLERENLTKKLKMAREEEHIYPTSQEDIENMKKKLQYLKNVKTQTVSKISRMRESRFEAKEKIRNINKSIEDSLDELNTLKISYMMKIEGFE